VNTAKKFSTNSEILFSLSAEAITAGIIFKAPRVGDAGFDLPSLEKVEIAPGKFQTLRTGIHLAIPLGYVGLVRDRSSVAIRGGACTAGVIDASYRGELKVVLHNLSEAPLSFEVGDRIAQILLLPHLTGDELKQVESVEALGISDRGSGGFGSTGA